MSLSLHLLWNGQSQQLLVSISAQLLLIRHKKADSSNNSRSSGKDHSFRTDQTSATYPVTVGTHHASSGHHDPRSQEGTFLKSLIHAKWLRPEEDEDDDDEVIVSAFVAVSHFSLQSKWQEFMPTKTLPASRELWCRYFETLHIIVCCLLHCSIKKTCVSSRKMTLMHPLSSW